LALASPLFASFSAFAQDGASPAAGSGLPSASPPPAASSPPPIQRPSLIPEASSAEGPAPVTPSTLVNPARDQQELAAQGAIEIAESKDEEMVY